MTFLPLVEDKESWRSASTLPAWMAAQEGRTIGIEISAIAPAFSVDPPKFRPRLAAVDGGGDTHVANKP